MALAYPVQSPAESSAYRTLQLHPRAPHDLIERAYWALAADIKKQLAASRPGVASLLRELNDAYSTLIDPPRRREYDDLMGFTAIRKRPVVHVQRRGPFGLGGYKPVKPARVTYYEILAVDRDAVPAIVEAAYHYRKAQVRPTTRVGAAELKLIDEAYETLRYGDRRMAYDAELSQRRARREAERDAAEAARAAAKAALKTRPAPAPAPPKPLRPTPDAAQAPSRVAPAMPPDEEPPLSSVGAAPEAPVTGVPAETAAPAEAPKRRWHLPSIGRLSAAQEAERLAEMERERARLLELGLVDGQPKEVVPLPHEESGAVRGRFVFVYGPQQGETIDLHDGSLILGSSDHADVVLRNPDGSIGAGHVRVWHRDGEYILHQLDTFSTTFVNGERLDLRLVILEGGDEIRIGPHVMRFEQLAAPDQQPDASSASTP